MTVQRHMKNFFSEEQEKWEEGKVTVLLSISNKKMMSTVHRK